MVTTFLPYADFKHSAIVLDNKRLGKQRIEVLMILNALNDKGHGYYNHAATRMWRGYSNALAGYGIEICKEWISRGYKDTTLSRIIDYYDPNEILIPNWFGYEPLHASHRSQLLFKNYDYYKIFGWKEIAGLPYVWPC